MTIEIKLIEEGLLDCDLDEIGELGDLGNLGNLDDLGGAGIMSEFCDVEQEYVSHLKKVFGVDWEDVYLHIQSNRETYSINQISGGKTNSVGIMKLHRLGGVSSMYLFLSSTVRGKGIGTQVLGQIEYVCLELGDHKMQVETIDDCGVQTFLEEHGYETQVVENHYFYKDVFICSKYLCAETVDIYGTRQKRADSSINDAETENDLTTTPVADLSKCLTNNGGDFNE
ncbi:hypothetical protein HN587_03620 [Candidatus Woesearchaeota archaeon]|jgi:GNAT superfamily N-acetyltransferase|nr:hypothetical protein [Candidatus Woesearchaeota archaeon]